MGKDAEFPDQRSHAERGNERAFVNQSVNLEMKDALFLMKKRNRVQG